MERKSADAGMSRLVHDQMMPILKYSTAATVAVVIILAAGCGSGLHEPAAPALPPTHLVGQVVLGSATGGVPALRVTARASDAPTHNASAAVDATGDFDFLAPIESWNTTAVDLIVDAPPGTTRAFHPTLSHVAADTAGVVARPFLVPENVTFTSNAFGTATVPFSTRAAFTPVCTDTSNANCNSFYPRTWLSFAPELWPEAALPIPVAFNRDGSTGAISASDSVALWANIAQMQDALGRKLFTPATISDLGPIDGGGFVSGAVVISIDNTLATGAGYTNWHWDAGGNVFEAKTRVFSSAVLASRGVITHELLHALGFHHTCAWPTVMGGYGCVMMNGATVQDAGAFTLAWTIRKTMLDALPTTTLADARNGEQQLETSIVTSRHPPSSATSIPYAPAARRAINVGGRLVMSDGAP